MTASDDRPAQVGQHYPFDERAEVLPLIPEGTGAVLDVGCGRGGFGRLLRRSGRLTTLWAVEQDETFAREAAPHYDEMIVGDFPEALVDRAMRFDCIVFNDVLEHMVDPWHALRRAQEHLEPAGAVVASIPNVRNARTLFNLCVLGDWAYVDMGVLDRTHLRFFTRKSIGAMFAEAGYRIENVRGINPLGQSHLAVGRMLPFFIRDFAYTGFGVRARLRPELK